MRHYNKVIIKVGGVLEFKIESWTEHNHMSLYSDDNPIFDGYTLEGAKVKEAEIQRICDIAKSYGMEAEIIK